MGSRATCPRCCSDAVPKCACSSSVSIPQRVATASSVFARLCDSIFPVFGRARHFPLGNCTCLANRIVFGNVTPGNELRMCAWWCGKTRIDAQSLCVFVEPSVRAHEVGRTVWELDDRASRMCCMCMADLRRRLPVDDSEYLVKLSGGSYPVAACTIDRRTSRAQHRFACTDL
jgi:hypothetical protein